MANNNIVIRISSDTSGSGVTANQSQTTGGQAVSPVPNQKQNQAGQSSMLNDLTKVLIIDSGRKVLQNVISQYGNLTGNSIAASRLQAGSTIVGYVAQIAIGGWIGAISVGADIGIQAFNNIFETRKANAQINLMKQRVGNSTLNGSRYTYD